MFPVHPHTVLTFPSCSVMPEPAPSIRTFSSEANCSLENCCPSDIKEQNWYQHLKISMGGTTILSVPTRIISDVFAIMTSHISRLSKSHTYFYPVLSLFPWFCIIGMRGKTCLPCNAYFSRTPDFTLSCRVHVCSSKHHEFA